MSFKRLLESTPITGIVIGVIVGAVVITAVGGLLVLPALRVETPTGNVFSTQTIVQSIKPLGYLTSLRVQMAKADILVNIRYGAANVCNIWANHVAQGSIEAGIDLSGIRPEDITFDAERNLYHLILPSAQITSCSLDPVATQQYASGGITPLCPANTDEIRRLASYEALIEFRNDAVENGILQQAQSQGEIVISNFIRALTGKDVEIEFRSPTQLIFPQSCMPEPPSPWFFNEQENRWVRQ